MWPLLGMPSQFAPRMPSRRRFADYGYLWWLQSFQVNGRKIPTYGMYGTGGNKLYVLPDQGVVVVITTTNFKVAGAGALTDQLFTTLIVPALPAP